jgi:hypothetical protein
MRTLCALAILLAGAARAQTTATTTTLSSAPNPSNAGDTVTLTASITAGGEIFFQATGSVTFSDGATTLATVPVSNFGASYSTASLSGGSHSLSATYSGDTHFGGSTGTTTQVVQGGGSGLTSTTTTLAPAPNPSTVGQSVTLTATVSPSAATGTVAFFDGATSLGTAPVSSGTAALSTGALALGSHSLSATYSGDSTDAGSTGNATQVVNAEAITVALTASPNPAALGQNVTLTASVTPASSSGTVTFLDGITTLGTADLASGSAVILTSTLAAGTHSLTATFSGASSTAVSLTVNAPTVTLTVVPNPASAGQSVTLTATVSPASSTGMISFLDGSSALGSATLSSGTASITTTTFSLGSHQLTASYNGNSSQAVGLTISSKPPTTTALSVSPNPSTAGQTVTLTATVSPSAATGTVTFTNGATTLGSSSLTNGAATFVTSALPVGNDSIVATYSGDATYLGSTSPLIPATVNAASGTPVSITITSNPPGTGFSVTGLGCTAGSYTTPQALTWLVGSTCAVAFTSPQTTAYGAQYVFSNWQDNTGAPNPRSFPVPTIPTTYVASFNTMYLLTTVASPANGGTISSGGYFAPGTQVAVIATPAAGYHLASITPAAVVTMSGPVTVTANFVSGTPPGNYTVTQIMANVVAPSGKPINNFGQVTAASGTNAVLWTPNSSHGVTGTLVNLGSLPGPTATFPTAINDFGQVVGTSVSQAFLWQPASANAVSGTMNAFLGSSAGISSTAGINGFGEIIGGQPSGSFLWTPSSANSITGSAIPTPSLTAINDFGQTINTAGGVFLLTPASQHGAPGPGVLIAAGTGLAINNSGAVLVYIPCPNPPQACNLGAALWIPNTPNSTSGVLNNIAPFVDLPSLAAMALNNNGQVVGTMSLNSASSSSLPFLYNGGSIYDLSLVPNWPAGGIPVGINDSGEIVVNANNGVYLLTSQAPQWSITMSHTGNFAQGQTGAKYTITVGNTSAAATSGTATLSVTLPTGFTFASITGPAWNCNGASCTRSDSLAPGTSYPALTLTVNVASSASVTPTYTPSATISGGGAASATATDPTTLSAAGASTPAVVSLSPTVSTGASQSFIFQFSDTAGWQSLSVVNVLINNSLDGRQACYLAYSAPNNVLYLVPDNGSGLLPGMLLNGGGSIANSQCSVSGAGSSASGSGNTLTLTLAITFTTSFAGNQVVYMAARDAINNSGWQTSGIHAVPPLPVSIVTMSPSSGAASTASLTLTYQGTGLQTMWALINTALDGRSACYIAYYAPGNQVFLFPDNGSGLQAASMTVGGSSAVTNSQCTVYGQGSSATQTASQTTVTLNVAFKPAFAGSKIAWLASQTLAGSTSPWQALGQWLVPSN